MTTLAELEKQLSELQQLDDGAGFLGVLSLYFQNDYLNEYRQHLGNTAPLLTKPGLFKKGKPVDPRPYGLVSSPVTVEYDFVFRAATLFDKTLAKFPGRKAHIEQGTLQTFRNARLLELQSLRRLTLAELKHDCAHLSNPPTEAQKAQLQTRLREYFTTPKGSGITHPILASQATLAIEMKRPAPAAIALEATAASPAAGADGAPAVAAAPLTEPPLLSSFSLLTSLSIAPAASPIPSADEKTPAGFPSEPAAAAVPIAPPLAVSEAAAETKTPAIAAEPSAPVVIHVASAEEHGAHHHHDARVAVGTTDYQRELSIHEGDHRRVLLRRGDKTTVTREFAFVTQLHGLLHHIQTYVPDAFPAEAKPFLSELSQKQHQLRPITLAHLEQKFAAIHRHARKTHTEITPADINSLLQDLASYFDQSEPRNMLDARGQVVHESDYDTERLSLRRVADEKVDPVRSIVNVNSVISPHYAFLGRLHTLLTAVHGKAGDQQSRIAPYVEKVVNEMLLNKAPIAPNNWEKIRKTASSAWATARPWVIGFVGLLGLVGVGFAIWATGGAVIPLLPEAWATLEIGLLAYGGSSLAITGTLYTIYNHLISDNSGEDFYHRRQKWMSFGFGVVAFVGTLAAIAFTVGTGGAPLLIAGALAIAWVVGNVLGQFMAKVLGATCCRGDDADDDSLFEKVTNLLHLRDPRPPIDVGTQHLGADGLGELRTAQLEIGDILAQSSNDPRNKFQSLITGITFGGDKTSALLLDEKPPIPTWKFEGYTFPGDPSGTVATIKCTFAQMLHLTAIIMGYDIQNLGGESKAESNNLVSPEALAKLRTPLPPHIQARSVKRPADASTGAGLGLEVGPNHRPADVVIPATAASVVVAPA